MKDLKRNRIVALLICVAVCVSLAISTVFIVSNADHNCTNDHCVICMQVKKAEKQIRRLKAALSNSAFTLTAVFVLCKTVLCTDDGSNGFTPVNLKVELLN